MNKIKKFLSDSCILFTVFVFILYIAGSLIFKTPNISSYGVIMIIIGMLSGITGSIIGINNKKNYRK